MSRNCAYCILYLVTEDISDFSGGRKHVVPGVVVLYFFIYAQMGRILILGMEMEEIYLKTQILVVKVYPDTQLIHNLPAPWSFQGTALFPQKVVHCMREP